MINLISQLIRSSIILSACTARVHTLIGRHDCAKLWYFIRSLDLAGSGVVELPVNHITSILNVSVSTVYRWLRLGKKKGFFRYYRVNLGLLLVYLGGLRAVCWKQNLANWGATAEIPLSRIINSLRPTVTEIVTTALQQKSHYAALRTRTPQAKKGLFNFGANDFIPSSITPYTGIINNFLSPLPLARIDFKNTNNSFNAQITAKSVTATNRIKGDSDEHELTKTNLVTISKPVLKQEQEMQSSPKSALGQVPFLLHVSPTRLFVSRNFLAFGATQNSISKLLDLNTKTVQRHIKAVSLSHRQLCQEKIEYKDIRFLMREGYDLSHHEVVYQGQLTKVGFTLKDDNYLMMDGVGIGNKSSEPNTFLTPKEGYKERFFKQGTQYFMAKCNIYHERLLLTTMKTAKKRWRRECSKRLQQLAL